MKYQYDVSVVLIGYQNYDFMENCLNSLYRYTHKVSFEVIVVANDHADANKTHLQKLFPSIHWINMGYNAGFSRANNIGIQQAKGKYILLLNADTLIPDLDVLFHVVYRMNKTPNIAACGVVQHNDNGKVAHLYKSFAFRKSFYILPPIFQKVLDRLIVEKKYNNPHQVDWLSGAFLLVKQSCIEQAGLMDEDFFLYAEDVEWCYRLGKTGALIYFDDLHIVHLENPSNPYRPKDWSFVNRFSEQIQLSNLLWVRKQFGILAYLSLIINYLLVIPFFYAWKIALNIFKFRNPFSNLENQNAFTQKVGLWLGFFWDMVLLRKKMYRSPVATVAPAPRRGSIAPLPPEGGITIVPPLGVRGLLFFTPLGGKSGSEMLLWNTLRQLDPNQHKAAVFCEVSGVLKNELPSNIPFYVNPFNRGGKAKLWAKLKQAAGQQVYEDYLLAIHKKHQIDCWYINTVAMAHIAPIAQKHNIPLICHFHELPHIIYELVKYDHLKAMVEHASLCIANANCTAETIKILGGNNIHRVYPFVEFDKIQPQPDRIQVLRDHLGIPSTSFVWAIAGAATFAKGIEYLPTLAEALPNCHFVWIGKNTGSGSYYFTEKMMAHKQLQNVHFVGLQSDDYYNYMAMSNGLLILSLEESFGMVALEAGYLGKPVVTFDSGGVKEIITSDTGTVVTSWNTEDMLVIMQGYINQQIIFNPQKAKENALRFSATSAMEAWNKAMTTI